MRKDNIDRTNRSRDAYSYDKNYLNRYYQYSSEAYDLYPEEENYEVQIEQPRKKKVQKKISRRKRSSMIRKRNDPKYVYEEQVERKLSASSIMTAIIIFLGMATYIGTFGMASVGRQTLVSMESELDKVRSDNHAIESGLLESLDMEKIETIAKVKLGMVVPGEHQKVYLDNIQKQSYFVQNDVEKIETGEETSLLHNILSVVTGLFVGN